MIVDLIGFSCRNKDSKLHRHWLYTKECVHNPVFRYNPKYHDYYYFRELLSK